jgi:hypothetical protein
VETLVQWYLGTVTLTRPLPGLANNKSMGV